MLRNASYVRKLAVAAAFALAFTPLAATGQQAGARTCAMSGNASVDNLSREWILVGWDRKNGDGPFSFREKLGKYYDWSAPDVMLYDDLDPERRVVRGPAAYGAIWEPLFSAMRSAEHRLAIPPSVLVSDDLAASNLQFVARLTADDGKVTGIRTFTSLAWRCTTSGWKIIREHNSSTILPSDQVDAVMDAASGN